VVSDVASDEVSGVGADVVSDLVGVTVDVSSPVEDDDS
jgi:hypothetical protein